MDTIPQQACHPSHRVTQVIRDRGSYKVGKRLADLHSLLKVEVGAWSAEVLVAPEPPVDAGDNLEWNKARDWGGEGEEEVKTMNGLHTYKP